LAVIALKNGHYNFNTAIEDRHKSTQQANAKPKDDEPIAPAADDAAPKDKPRGNILVDGSLKKAISDAENIVANLAVVSTTLGNIANAASKDDKLATRSDVLGSMDSTQTYIQGLLDELTPVLMDKILGILQQELGKQADFIITEITTVQSHLASQEKDIADIRDYLNSEDFAQYQAVMAN